MALTKKEFSAYIRQFNFRELFNDMGWNNDKTVQPIALENLTFSLQGVAEKSGFKILVCSHLEDGSIPDYITRKKIESKVTKLFQEHLIIFSDRAKTEQVWQLVVRQAGKPTKITETRYRTFQDPELLFQRAAGIFFELDEEDHITIVDVTQRISDNFHQNNEKVTKQFYDKFKKEHSTFYDFLKGIDDHIDEWNKKNPKDKKENLNKQWYASLMLNRLMFCYFIQKKGFLNNDKNYLRVKLKACKELKGKNKFYSFYRNFLLALFHHGLGAPDHTPDLKEEIGKIPYLNGGLFDVHELETTFAEIDIDDQAFEKIFDFFDQYEWHLDTRITATGKDINPDVIGYIFEKYINDRAKMGAYYTKEDITDYISKSCIIPYLFDETKRRYPKAFEPKGEVWEMVTTSKDLYIYDAIKKGVTISLPSEINQGIETVSKRTDWNKPASPEFALPTEIWREVVDRRGRYLEIQATIDKGGITSISDFITYNLNIRQFAQDLVESSNDPVLLKNFYKALTSVTIIDPTCGSGAFLFAAMNILEPLYETCIQRMENFVAEAPKGKFKFFEETLEKVKSPDHPNLQYYIYKTIILQNLYGVDIMKEAVEIAKLRLFLKLVATVEADYRKPNLGLEPLPDIDFNIKAGNTLVGFASLNEAVRAINEKDKKGQLGLVFQNEIDVVNEVKNQAEDLSLVYRSFKNSQLDEDMGAFKAAKDKLVTYTLRLNRILNQYSAFGFGIDYSSQPDKFNDWLKMYQPFHWFSEFYEIIQGKGGFDVIIGNPPYLEFNQVPYRPDHFVTSETSAVHAVCIERSLSIKNKNGSIGMIVPLSLVSTQRMKTIQELIESHSTTYYSNFSWRPAKLFDTVNRALTIFIANSSTQKEVFTSTYLKWSSETREGLLTRLNFITLGNNKSSFWIPKIENRIEKKLLEKILSKKNLILSYIQKSSNRIYYRSDGGLYWKVFTNFPPAFILNGKEGSSTREVNISVGKKEHVYPFIAILSSNTFWWWYSITSNCRHLNPYDVQNFHIDDELLEDQDLQKLGEEYIHDLRGNSKMLMRNQKQTGVIQTQSFKISLSKSIIDRIDMVLAKHYGFSVEELDFILNYDIKYRMGKEIESDED